MYVYIYIYNWFLYLLNLRIALQPHSTSNSVHFKGQKTEPVSPVLRHFWRNSKEKPWLILPHHKEGLPWNAIKSCHWYTWSQAKRTRDLSGWVSCAWAAFFAEDRIAFGIIITYIWIVLNLYPLIPVQSSRNSRMQSHLSTFDVTRKNYSTPIRQVGLRTCFKTWRLRLHRKGIFLKWIQACGECWGIA